MIENCEKLAEQLYPERPISLPDGPAVVVPVPERRAFIAGAAWQAAQERASAPRPASAREDEEAEKLARILCELLYENEPDCVLYYGGREEKTCIDGYFDIVAAVAEALRRLRSPTRAKQEGGQAAQPAPALPPSEREEVLAVLEPFARKADSVSLSDALGHIERVHLMAARDLVAQLRRAEEPTDDA